MRLAEGFHKHLGVGQSVHIGGDKVLHLHTLHATSAPNQRSHDEGQRVATVP